MLDLIVKAINETLNTHLFKDERFSVALLHGIVETTTKYEESDSGLVAKEVAPCIIYADGEDKPIYPDGDFPVMVFHKIEGSAIKNKVKQYGRDVSGLERLSVMKMVFIGFREKIKVSRDQMDLAITAAFPTTLSHQSLQNLALKNCSIKVLSSSHRSDEIYQREWQYARKPLDPSIMIFEVNYQIECTFDKSCINPICC